MHSIKETCEMLIGCTECSKLYGGKCDELKQEEERGEDCFCLDPGDGCHDCEHPECTLEGIEKAECLGLEDFSDEDDGFADEKEPLFVATLRLIVGNVDLNDEIEIDKNWYLANGTVEQIKVQIQSICENINKLGFIAVPQNGTICCINKDDIFKMKLVLEEA